MDSMGGRKGAVVLDNELTVMAAYCLSLGRRVQDEMPRLPIVYGGIGGGRYDSALGADSVTALHGRAFLIEFKAARTAFRREREKKNRQGYFDHINTSEYAEATRRAHWVAFYRSGKIRLSPYVNLVAEDFANLLMRDSRELAHFLSTLLHNKEEIGLPFPEFRSYLKQLQEWSGKASGDAMPVVAIWYEKDAGLRVEAGLTVHALPMSPSAPEDGAPEEKTRGHDDSLTDPSEGGGTTPRPPRR